LRRLDLVLPDGDDETALREVRQKVERSRGDNHAGGASLV
jgi:hypothetical protein